MKLSVLFVLSIYCCVFLLFHQVSCKHAVSVSEIEDLLSLVKKTIELKQNDEFLSNTTQNADTTDMCVKKCRNNYMTALLDSDIEQQTGGADVFIKCFPACFIAKDHGKIMDPIKCKLSCGTAFHNCYLKSQNVESFTCVVGKDTCEADCDSLKEKEDSLKKKGDSLTGTLLDSLEKQYDFLAKLYRFEFVRQKRMVNRGSSFRCFMKCLRAFNHCSRVNAITTYESDVCDRLQSQCNRQCYLDGQRYVK